ncbi:hypothetical protein NMY22_g10757 [Coprinellus aureogranulatus]|nr:hypothetical protein NMY22_g10757 [Coprinellus aureogranulatus]
MCPIPAVPRLLPLSPIRQARTFPSYPNRPFEPPFDGRVDQVKGSAIESSPRRMAPSRTLPSTTPNDPGSQDSTGRYFCRPTHTLILSRLSQLETTSQTTAYTQRGLDHPPQERLVSRFSPPTQPPPHVSLDTTASRRAHCTNVHDSVNLLPRRHSHPDPQIRVQSSTVPSLDWRSRDPLHVAAPMYPPHPQLAHIPFDTHESPLGAY